MMLDKDIFHVSVLILSIWEELYKDVCKEVIRINSIHPSII
jgi:hypothetical protein